MRTSNASDLASGDPPNIVRLSHGWLNLILTSRRVAGGLERLAWRCERQNISWMSTIYYGANIAFHDSKSRRWRHTY
jgi:hypothetical protein